MSGRGVDRRSKEAACSAPLSLSLLDRCPCSFEQGCPFLLPALRWHCLGEMQPDSEPTSQDGAGMGEVLWLWLAPAC